MPNRAPTSRNSRKRHHPKHVLKQHQHEKNGSDAAEQQAHDIALAFLVVIQKVLVGQGAKPHLVESVTGVTDELAEKDLLVGIERVDDDVVFTIGDKTSTVTVLSIRYS